MSGTAVSPAATASETLPSRSNSATTSAARSGSTRDVAAVARATARVREGSDGPFFTPAAAAASAARSRERVTSGSGGAAGAGPSAARGLRRRDTLHHRAKRLHRGRAVFRLLQGANQRGVEERVQTLAAVAAA